MKIFVFYVKQTTTICTYAPKNKDKEMVSSLGNAVLAIAWVFNGVGALVVAARYYARIKIIRRFAIDDALILLTLVSSKATSTVGERT